jgi:hypothetical protein
VIIDVRPIGELTGLKKFTLETNPHSNYEFVNFRDLGNVLTKTKHLQYLKIHTFMNNQSFEDFFSADSSMLDDLKELDFNF